MFQVHSKVIQLYIYTYIIFEIIFLYKLLKDINYSSLCLNELRKGKGRVIRGRCERDTLSLLCPQLCQEVFNLRTVSQK